MSFFFLGYEAVKFVEAFKKHIKIAQNLILACNHFPFIDLGIGQRFVYHDSNVCFLLFYMLLRAPR